MTALINFDQAATTPVLDSVIEKIIDTYREEPFNPSSQHSGGASANKKLESCREVFSEILGVKSQHIFFTSGGSESINTAIKGPYFSVNNRQRPLITTFLEHSATKQAVKFLESTFNTPVNYLNTDSQGRISLQNLEEFLEHSPLLVTILLTSNETGVIQDYKKISSLIRKISPKTLIHYDGVQSLYKTISGLSDIDADMISLSAHKFNGPKGIGILHCKKPDRITSLIHGGNQEKGLRSGTENLPLITGMLEAAFFHYKNYSHNIQLVYEFKQLFLHSLLQCKIPYEIISPRENCSNFILNISFPGIKGEVLQHLLEQKGVLVSTGSACNSRKKIISSVLQSLQLPEKVIESAIRFSFSHLNNKNEIDHVIHALNAIYQENKIFFQ